MSKARTMGEGDSSSGFINPSLGIVKSWQGIVELILRGVTIVRLVKLKF